MRVTRRTCGFTLVELLVVIGIIALLISILLPALSAARKAGSTVKCLSHLREIGSAFLYYASENKGFIPPVRQDYPEVNGIPTNVQNFYWTDFLIPYTSKSAKMNFQASGGQQANDFEAARKKSVIWGCPEWEGWTGTGGSFIAGIERFSAGYSMNHYPSYKMNNPPVGASVQNVPAAEWNMRSPTITGEATGGKRYKLSQYTQPAERALVIEADLWLLGFGASTDGTLQRQTATRSLRNAPGANNIDYYRHGKRGRLIGNEIDRNGSKQATNVLYADGHAGTVYGDKQAYKTIRMRLP
jgi:prepilin-type N-terminal cleavage/methylation domain-containing protein/prepilin-type processing-associated H-X9-DG protein